MRHLVDLKTKLPLPYRDVCDLLRERSARTLNPVAGTTVTDGHRLSTTLDVGVGTGTHIRRAVFVDLGVYTETAVEARLPLHIAAEARPTLFPTLDADIVLRDLGGSGTSVAIAGTIRDPLGPLGALGAAVGGRSLAESSLEAFFLDLLHRIGLEVRDARPAWSPPAMPTSLSDR
jgi:hypothetical protein